MRRRPTARESLTFARLSVEVLAAEGAADAGAGADRRRCRCEAVAPETRIVAVCSSAVLTGNVPLSSTPGTNVKSCRLTAEL